VDAVCAVHAEIVVFNIKDRDIPIVHRAIKVHERASKTPHTDILTKVTVAVYLTCETELALMAARVAATAAVSVSTS
jgi:hypothetical protein